MEAAAMENVGTFRFQLWEGGNDEPVKCVFCGETEDTTPIWFMYINDERVGNVKTCAKHSIQECLERELGEHLR